MDKSLRPVARPRTQTGEMTKYNRPVWRDEQTGEVFSEKTITVPYGDGFVVMPSVTKDGSQLSEEQVYEYVKRNGPIDFVTGEKLPIFESPEQADTYARGRSDKMFSDEKPMPEFKSRRPEMVEEEAGTSMMDVGKAVAKLGLAGAQLAGKKLGMDINPTADNPMGFAEGGNVPMNKQMEMFEDGGLKDEGGMVDEVSGNDVPPGSTRKEVRDDIPAMLSEGEFVFPADVVRYYGLEKLMELRQNAKMGLKRMEDMGQMGNSDEATLPDDLPFGMDDLVIIAEPQRFAEGGMPQTTPLPIAPVPTRGPNTSLLSGMTSGMRMVTYVNDEGNTMVIPHVNGVPIYPVPDGYRVMAEGESVTGSDAPASNTGTQQTSSTQTTTQQRPEEFDGGPDPEPSDFDLTELSDAELDAMIEAPDKLGTKATAAVASILGTPLMGFAVRGLARANSNRAKAEKARRAINEDVQKTIDELKDEVQETPVKGAPVSDVNTSNLDSPAESKSNIDDVDLPSSFNYSDDDTVMSQPVSVEPAFLGFPSVPEVTTTTLGPAPKGLPSMPPNSLMPDVPVPSLPSGSTTTPPTVGTPVVGTPQSVPSQTDVPTPASFNVPSFPNITSQAVANATNQAAQLAMGETFAGDGRTPDQAGTPGYSIQGPQTTSGFAPTSVVGQTVGGKSPTFGLTGTSGSTSDVVGLNYSGIMSGTQSADRDAFDLGETTSEGLDAFGGRTPDTPSFSGSIAGQAEAEAAMGLDPFGGEGPSVGPTGGGNNDGGGTGPSGSSGGGATGGGGADSGTGPSGGNASPGASGVGAPGVAGGEVGSGPNGEDAVGPMAKGGLVSKKKKPAKRKPNTSRGIAARKK